MEVANNVSRMHSSSLQSTRVSWPSIWQNSGRTRLAANLFSITCHYRDIVGKMQNFFFFQDPPIQRAKIETIGVAQTKGAALLTASTNVNHSELGRQF